MADFFPDIMGEYLSEEERFETDNIQFGGHFEPAAVAPGGMTSLYLFLQNTLDAPIKVGIQIDVPKTSGLFRGGKPILEVGESIIRFEMGPGEAGLLTLPASTTRHAKSGQYELGFTLQAEAQEDGERIRPTSSRSQFDIKLIDDPVGLDLAASLGTTYTAEEVQKASFTIKVEGDAQEPSSAQALEHGYQVIWEKAQLDFLVHAQHEVKLRQAKLKEELMTEPLYIAMYSESVNRFADMGIGLRIGEAILIAKILTFTCELFLTSPKRMGGLLIPIWERAVDGGIDTTDPFQVIRWAGYTHILKLGIATSFGLIAQTIGQQPWSLEERQAVSHHLVDNIEIGEPTEFDFIYLPLMLGGALVSNKLQMDGEDLQHTAALVYKAYKSRDEIFSDDEMKQAKRVFETALKRLLKS